MKKLQNVKHVFLFLLPLILSGCQLLVSITTPPSESHYEVGQEITFTGDAMSIWDGNIPEKSFVWYLDSKNTLEPGGIELGRGRKIVIDDLPEGKHSLVLSVTNSLGET